MQLGCKDNVQCYKMRIFDYFCNGNPKHSNMIHETLLQLHSIRPTAIRLLVIKSILSLNSTFSLEDLCISMETIDKSTLFRTLSLFEEHRILHSFEDGLGKRKYCLCRNYNHPQTDMKNHDACHHIHVTCKVCGRTFCLKHEQIPPIPHLPEGFDVENVNYIIVGVCTHCKRH